VVLNQEVPKAFIRPHGQQENNRSLAKVVEEIAQVLLHKNKLREKGRRTKQGAKPRMDHTGEDT